MLIEVLPITTLKIRRLNLKNNLIVRSTSGWFWPNPKKFYICFFIVDSDSPWCQESKTVSCHFGIVEQFATVTSLWRHNKKLRLFMNCTNHGRVWYQTTPYDIGIMNIVFRTFFEVLWRHSDVIMPKRFFTKQNKPSRVWCQTTPYPMGKINLPFRTYFWLIMTS